MKTARGTFGKGGRAGRPRIGWRLMAGALLGAVAGWPATPGAGALHDGDTPEAPVVAVGLEHSLVAYGGAVWTWGHNAWGALGNGTTAARYQPAPVPGLAGVRSVAGGNHSSFALMADGTVRAWGWDRMPEISFRLSPEPAPHLAGVRTISGNVIHLAALQQDGTAWAWGWDDYGQCGTMISSHSLPLQVPGLSGVVAVAAGGWHTLALMEDGTVRAWGNNYYGQLGDGTTATRLAPVFVAGLSDVAAIAAGWGYSAALRRDGTVWAWGNNYYGQLGNGSLTDSRAPVPASGLTGVTAIAAGAGHVVALRANGTVRAWGYNEHGELGDGRPTPALPHPWGMAHYYSATPTPVSGLTGVVSIAARFMHSLAVTTDGTVWGWGANYAGQVGDGTTVDRTVPVPVWPTVNDVAGPTSERRVPEYLDAGDGASAESVPITWRPVPQATRYRICRSTTHDSHGAIELGTTAGLTFTDDSAAPGQIYYYWVQAFNGSDATGWNVNHGHRHAAAPLEFLVEPTAGIDLIRHTHSCTGIPSIRFIQEPADHQALIALDLDPARTAAAYVRLDVEYGETPRRWTVNIGDSPTCNGWGSDAGSQFHNMEFNVYDAGMQIYGSAYTPPPELEGSVAFDEYMSSRLLRRLPFAAQGRTLTWVLGNHYLAWDNHAGDNGELHGPQLFALNGQPDRLGPVNYTLYAAFNRAIDGPYRDGSGAARVWISLLDADGRPILQEPPPAPAGVAASDGAYEDRVRITWNPVLDATGYEVWRGVPGDPLLLLADPVEEPVFEDCSAVPGVTYSYSVKAKNRCGTGGYGTSDTGYAALPVFTIAAGAGPGGVIVPSGAIRVTGGDSQSFAITPDPGHAVADVLVDGVSVGPVLDFTFHDVQADHTLAATFAAIPPPVTLTAEPSSGEAPLEGILTALVTDGRPILTCEWDTDGNGTFDHTTIVPTTGYSLATPGSYTLRVRVTDTHGLTGEASVTIQVGAPGQTKVWISTPKSGARLSGRVSLVGHAAPASCVASAQFEYQAAGAADWIALGPVLDPTPFAYQFEWDLTSLAEGPYRLRLVVTETSGRYQASDPVDLVVVTAAPSGDYDGDGRADPAVYIESAGLWHILLSGAAYRPVTFTLGGPGQTPVPADYDGDRRTDPAVYAVTQGLWLGRLSGSGYPLQRQAVGLSGVLVPADYDGDRRTDLALYRPATGEWWIRCSAEPPGTTHGYFGGPGRMAVPADYDGDGKADPAVHAVGSGAWQVLLSGAAYQPSAFAFGGAGDVPVPADYDGDRKADPAVYASAAGVWRVMRSGSGYAMAAATLGGAGFFPAPADYAGTGRAAPAVYREATGEWFILVGPTPSTLVFGGAPGICVSVR